jgi:glycosyltransferase involved in cell wall biosynthesis
MNTRPRDHRVIAGFLKSAYRLAKHLRAFQFDLFHTQNTGCEEAPLAARLAGIPRIVGTFHTDSTYDLHSERSSWGYRFLERLSNRSLHRAIAVSAATGRNWQRRTFLPSPRITTIHNGIDAGKFRRQNSRAAAKLKLDLPHDAFVVLGLGRLDEAKGFADLIAAAGMLHAAVPKLLVLIAGEGPLRQSLQNQAQSLGVNVHFAGFVSEIQPLLDAADLFALPSLCEACPYAVLEAMAAGAPVLASDVGGVSEMIRRSGTLLPPRNPAAWATAIHRLANDEPRRLTMEREGLERVTERFREEEMVRATFQLYRELLQ